MIVRCNSQLVADRGSAKSAESVRQGGYLSGGDQKLFDFIRLARQGQPAFVAQLPSGIDEKRSRFELTVPRQPTQRRVPN